MMEITERHIIIFSIVTFVIAIGLFIYLPFIGIRGHFANTKKQPLGTKEPFIATTVDIEKLCEVDVSENKWKYIVLHHSATDEGNAYKFDRYHRKEKKWKNGLAYHFVIGNGKGSREGEIEVGNRWKRQIHGAHTANKDINRVSIGICLVGNFEKDYEPAYNQLESLVSLVNYLAKRYNISKSNIIMHNQVVQKNTACPGKNFPYEKLMERIASSQSARTYRGL
ncbi:MAG TPA: N-acetylmuramoyl-L-alanine amidase [Candidatus Scalindua sp.]|nr:N-acetylmuramoyl-L-alanine amidase [Candidatus Scalindua sp.]